MLTPRATTRRLLNHVIASPCTRHDKRAGEPCWEFPCTEVPGKNVQGACGARVRLTFHARGQR